MTVSSSDVRPSRCPATRNRRQPGEVCGRPVVGFLAHGHGRCAYHLTARERVRVMAVVRAERELLELRAMGPGDEECEQQPETECDEAPASGPGFDSERFSSADLDE